MNTPGWRAAAAAAMRAVVAVAMRAVVAAVAAVAMRTVAVAAVAMRAVHGKWWRMSCAYSMNRPVLGLVVASKYRRRPIYGLLRPRTVANRHCPIVLDMYVP